MIAKIELDPWCKLVGRLTVSLVDLGWNEKGSFRQIVVSGEALQLCRVNQHVEWADRCQIAVEDTLGKSGQLV